MAGFGASLTIERGTPRRDNAIYSIRGQPAFRTELFYSARHAGPVGGGLVVALGNALLGVFARHRGRLQAVALDEVAGDGDFAVRLHGGLGVWLLRASLIAGAASSRATWS